MFKIQIRNFSSNCIVFSDIFCTESIILQIWYLSLSYVDIHRIISNSQSLSFFKFSAFIMTSSLLCKWQWVFRNSFVSFCMVFDTNQFDYSFIVLSICIINQLSGFNHIRICFINTYHLMLFYASRSTKFLFSIFCLKVSESKFMFTIHEE